MMNVIRALSATVLIGLSSPVWAQSPDGDGGVIHIAPVLTGLSEPWGLAFLSQSDADAGFLVTEREGRLLLVRDGKVKPLEGIPDVWDDGQGGLLDVMVPRDFASSRQVWLTYAAPAMAAGDTGGATAVGVGELSPDADRLVNFRTVWTGRFSDSGRHFGARVIEAPDGTVFVTTGDRGTGPDGLEAQDPVLPEGKVIHLNRDGTPASSLPGWQPAFYSLGHRNMQGAAVDAAGQLWVVEHGAQGGDELNLVRSGANYGWPVISYGRNYNGDKIGKGVAQEGMEQPVHYWDPSIAPSGLVIYDGAMFPQWRGHFLTGSLNSDFISRLDLQDGFAEHRITAPETGRVRDIAVAPDGSVWFLSVTDGAIYRISPAK